MAIKLASRVLPYAAFGLAFSAAVANVYGCSSSNSTRPTGTTGSTGSSGTSGTSGTGTGTTGTTGGTTGTAGTATGTTGSSTGSAAGTSGTSGTMTSPVEDGGCTLPATQTSGGNGLVLYSGGVPNPNCPQTIDYLMGTWFSYNDGTDAGAGMTEIADTSDACGSTTCTYHVTGMGFMGYGAGVGFTLNSDGTSAIEASTNPQNFTGIEVSLLGTTTGTRQSHYDMGDNYVHVKIPTTVDRANDEYGFYCPVSSDWTQCVIPFSSMMQDGFGNLDAGAFDPTTMTKVQFEFSSYTPPPDPDSGVQGPSATVSFDVRIADVAFY
jgi:hypothetical protein